MIDEQEGPYKHLKPVRNFLIVLLVIFSILFILANMVTLNFLRGTLEERTNGHVKISGDIKLGWDGFHPTLLVTDVVAYGVSLKSAETRISFDKPAPGKPVMTRVLLTGVVLPGRPSVDFDIPAQSDSIDSSIDDFEARAGDSLMSGNISYRGHALDTNITATKLDYGFLYPGASGGAAEGTLTLKGFGSSQFELTGNASGHLVLTGGKGKIPGRALALWGGNVLAALLPSDATVNCAVAEFDMKNGIATATRIGVDTDSLNITGTGTIDFNTMYMNMVFTPQPKVESSFNTAVPLSVTGVLGQVEAAPAGTPVAVNTAATSPCAAP